MTTWCFRRREFIRPARYGACGQNWISLRAFGWPLPESNPDQVSW